MPATELATSGPRRGAALALAGLALPCALAALAAMASLSALFWAGDAPPTDVSSANSVLVVLGGVLLAGLLRLPLLLERSPTRDARLASATLAPTSLALLLAALLLIGGGLSAWATLWLAVSWTAVEGAIYLWVLGGRPADSSPAPSPAPPPNTLAAMSFASSDVQASTIGSVLAEEPLPIDTRNPLDDDPLAAALGPAVAGVWQQSVRLREGAGETVLGRVVLEFAAGQRSATTHVAFCPPLANRPEVEVECVDGEPSEATVEQVEVGGARFKATISPPPEAPCQTVLVFTATGH